jgi:hypothetical protein
MSSPDEDDLALEAEMLAALEADDAPAVAAGSTPGADIGAPAALHPPTQRRRRGRASAPPPAAPPRQLDAGRRPAPPPTAAGASAGASGGLAALPAPLLLRVLSHLSPEDLCAAARAGHALRAPASDPALWRSLYLVRWPAGATAAEQGGEDRLEAASWQARYMRRDGAEVGQQVMRAPEPQRELYLQMATAKRSEALGRAARAALLQAPAPSVPGTLAARVDEFRRGLRLRPGGGGGGGGGGGTCVGVCAFVELERNYWICERGGELHVCGEACGERHIDAASRMPVCRITGRCFGRMVSEGEEGGGGGGEGGGEGGEDWNAEEGGMGGRLGRAFFAGYHAADEQEMLRRFGVRF